MLHKCYNGTMNQDNRLNIILSTLEKLYPHPKIALNYSNTFELLVGVILSAQCTDKKVNEVTEKLFKKYKTVDDYAKADFEEFCKDIHSTGFYRNKAKNVIGAAQKVRMEFKGKVPRTMKELLTLPGVARKTANVVLGEAYGVYDGIAVDTHMKRLCKKFGLTGNIDPVKIEQDLMGLIHRDKWPLFAIRLIQYGRDYSPASKVNSNEDPVSQALIKYGR